MSTTALINAGARELGATPLGVLVKILADPKYDSTTPRILPLSSSADFFGLTRRALAGAIQDLGERGYLHVGFVTGSAERRRTTTIRLLTPSESDALAGRLVGGVADVTEATEEV